jgi:nicotinamide-nucleotide amidase
VGTAELVLELLRERGLTLSTAESCTGGLVGARLTDVPGSSDVFVGGVIAYSDDVKEAELDVPAATLAAHGAVSAEVAAAMARGGRARLGSDVAVAVTGVAGPGGGTDDKPVGLVYVHASGPMGERDLRLDFPGDRATIRGRATVAALQLVRRLVTEL